MGHSELVMLAPIEKVSISPLRISSHSMGQRSSSTSTRSSIHMSSGFSSCHLASIITPRAFSGSVLSWLR